jgi:hypothetical protein
MRDLLRNPRALTEHISETLHARSLGSRGFPADVLLSPMTSEDLLMFRRILYPMAAWINRQKHFLPNWEVEKIVHVPLRELLNPESYACYRLHFNVGGKNGGEGYVQDFPCFVLRNEREQEVLWGATFRIVMSFLNMVFGFSAPPVDSLPVIYKTLDERYLNGSP